jgi:hypothetical protein
MDERYFKDKISAYLDNELSPQERSIVDEYIRTHPEAQELLARLESLKRVSKGNMPLGGDDLYWERNARKIESAIGAAKTEAPITTESSSWQNHWGKLTAVAASAVILFFIATNRDEVEKKALPPPALQLDGASKSSSDTTAPIELMPLMEKPTPVKKDIVQQKSVSKREEIAVAKEETTREKFAVSVPKVSDKEAITSISPQMSNQMTPQSKVSSQSAEIAESVSPSASADVVAEAKSDSVVLTLEDWFRIRDSLDYVLEEERAKELARTRSYLPAMDLIESERLMMEDMNDDPKSPERVWLDANFHIAQLTADSTHRATAIEALRMYEGHSNHAVRKKASEYLKKLTDK